MFYCAEPVIRFVLIVEKPGKKDAVLDDVERGKRVVIGVLLNAVQERTDCVEMRGVP